MLLLTFDCLFERLGGGFELVAAACVAEADDLALVDGQTVRAD
jgi:hypothetical protein